MLLVDRNDITAIASDVQLAADNLQRNSGQNQGSHSRAVDACLDAITKLNAMTANREAQPFEQRWPATCSQAAAQEGWDLFECGGTLVQIQRDDDFSELADDACALAHVLERAAAGSDLHRRALLVAMGLA